MKKTWFSEKQIIAVICEPEAEMNTANVCRKHGLRDGTPCAVVGDVTKLSMVATRRLQLVAADADLPVLLLRRRRRREDDPLSEPSAAWTRWRIANASSERLGVAGVGRARWSVELIRQRCEDAFSLIVEGCDETGRLAVPAALSHRAAETAGTLRTATG